MIFRHRPRLESAVEKDAVSKAKKLGWKSIKIGFDGWPDRLFIKKAVYVWVELKRPTRRGRLTSERQDRKIRTLRDDGCIVHVLDNYEDILALLAISESDL